MGKSKLLWMCAALLLAIGLGAAAVMTTHGEAGINISQTRQDSAGHGNLSAMALKKLST